MPFIDVRDQTYDILGALNGGTNNGYGAAQEQVVVPFVNDSGATLAIGDCIKLNPGIRQTDTAGEFVLGVIVGSYDATTGVQEIAAPVHGQVAAVCIAGHTQVRIVADVLRGTWLMASSTAGQATTSTGGVTIGAFAHVLRNAGAGGLAEVILGGGASGTGLGAGSQYYTINFLISAGGAATPQLGSQGAVSVDAAGTIVSARMLALSSGSAVVDIEKSTYAGWPTTSSICGGSKPTLSGASKSEDTTLSGWTTALAAGDVLLFQLDSISGIFVVSCALKVRRS